MSLWFVVCIILVTEKVSQKVVYVDKFDCFWDYVMVMKTASCILGPVNTLLILKNFDWTCVVLSWII